MPGFRASRQSQLVSGHANFFFQTCDLTGSRHFSPPGFQQHGLVYQLAGCQVFAHLGNLSSFPATPISSFKRAISPEAVTLARRVSSNTVLFISWRDARFSRISAS